jgi:hypothetical protein
MSAVAGVKCYANLDKWREAVTADGTMVVKDVPIDVDEMGVTRTCATFDKTFAVANMQFSSFLLVPARKRVVLRQSHHAVVDFLSATSQRAVLGCCFQVADPIDNDPVPITLEVRLSGEQKGHLCQIDGGWAALIAPKGRTFSSIRVTITTTATAAALQNWHVAVVAKPATNSSTKPSGGAGAASVSASTATATATAAAPAK